MKPIKLPLAFLFSVAFVGHIIGQENPDVPEPNQINIISYDTDTKTITGKIPFDNFFKLVIPKAKYRKVGSKVDLFRMVYNDGLRVTKWSLVKEGDSFEKELRGLTLKPSLDGKSKYVIIPPLKPNKLYEIVLEMKPSDQMLVDLYNIMKKIPHDSVEARKDFEKKIVAIETTENRIKDIPRLQSFEKLYNQTINEFNPILDLFNCCTHLLDYTETISSSDIGKIGNALAENKLESKEFKNAFFEFTDTNPTKIKELTTGNRVLGMKVNDEPTNLLNRRINLEKSITKLNATVPNLKHLQVLDSDPDIQSFYKDALMKLLHVLTTNLEAIKEPTSKINATLINYYSYNELISISTSSKNIDTKNATYLVTDFGFTNSLAFTNNGATKYIGRPHFGVNWHIGGINKDQKLNHISKKYRRTWHKWSIAFGVTLGKIEEEGFLDLFNNISPTLGVNYRIAQQVRLGTGALFLQQKDRNPLLNDKHLSIAPYLNISFDFSLFNSVGKLASSFFK